MLFKKFFCLLLVFFISVQLSGMDLILQPVMAEDFINQSRMLKVKENKIVYADDESVDVVLSGVNIPGGEWTNSPDNEKVMRSTLEAMSANWNCNVIRLAVSTIGWYGEKFPKSNWQPTDGGASYRAYYDNVINEISKAGKYVVLDLHEYDIFYERQLNFWKEVAAKYANNPTVLFGILNEPTPSSWSIWKYGDGGSKIGHQKVVETIRDLGAKNIIVAGGMSFSGDLTGVGGDYALIDQGSGGEAAKAGNGIMYDLHKYPLHGGVAAWDSSAGAARKKYPILMGEFGWSDGLLKKTYYPGDQQYHDKWFPEIFDWMNNVDKYGNYVNFTAYCFHTSSAPNMLDPTAWSNGNYVPTTFFGTYVRDELKRRLGENITLNKTVTSSAESSYYPGKNAVDGDNSTLWFTSTSANKHLKVDLGETFLINRWIISHSSISSEITVNFKLQTSMDGLVWNDTDVVAGNTASLTDRFFKPTYARYVRLYITKPALSGNSTRISEFSVFGKDGRQITPITPPDNVNGNDPFLATKDEIDFTKGTTKDTLDYWTKTDPYISVTYPQGMAENGGNVLHLTGGTANQENVFGLTGRLNDFNNVEQWKFRMKSTKDINIRFDAEYRISNSLKSTKIITIPSTNGEWKDFSFNIADLMPTSQDTWVRTMRTMWNSTASIYEPVIKFIIIGNLGEETVDISDIKALHYLYGYNVSSLEFTNGGIVCNDGLKAGVTDINIRLNNKDAIYSNNILLYAAMYEKETNKLVSSAIKTICLPPSTQIQAQKLSLTMPNGSSTSDYYIKTFVWNNSNTIIPVSNSIILDNNGVHNLN